MLGNLGGPTVVNPITKESGFVNPLTKAFVPIAPPSPAPTGYHAPVVVDPITKQAGYVNPMTKQFVPQPGLVPPLGGVQPHPVDQGFGPAPVGTQASGGQMTTDAQLAHSASQHLANALASVNDPELRQSLATAMATLHKYVAGIHKEHQDALAGKVSPRLLQHAYGTAPMGSALMYGPAAGSVL